MKVPIADHPELRRRFGAQWTPTLVLVDGDGEARHRVCPASLPPETFVPVLLAGLGRAYLAAKRPDEAIARFDRVAERHAGSIAAPEALYWKGVALYHKQDKAGMLAAWRRITAEHPGSFWGQAIAFLAEKE